MYETNKEDSRFQNSCPVLSSKRNEISNKKFLISIGLISYIISYIEDDLVPLDIIFFLLRSIIVTEREFLLSRPHLNLYRTLCSIAILAHRLEVELYRQV